MALNCGYPYVGGLSFHLMGFGFGKSCTKPVNHMALNCVIPYVGCLSIHLMGFGFGKSCTKLVNHLALNCVIPYVGGLSIQLTGYKYPCMYFKKNKYNKNSYFLSIILENSCTGTY